VKRTSVLVVALIALFVVVLGGCAEEKINKQKETSVKEIDLAQFKDTKPVHMKRLLFIHHSVGGQWLADKGDEKDIIPSTCLYQSHPNGGGLRALLIQNNYQVHEASYKSALGEKTDGCDWNAKFRDKMDMVLRCDLQDWLYKDVSGKNDIVMFKSCFPNNDIESEGKDPGDPDSPKRTTANYKAAYKKLLGYFSAHPETLFVCVTAPPLAKDVPSRTREFIKNLIGSESSATAIGARARRFNNWLKDTEKGWLAGYPGKNVVVFDYYDVLTGHGKSNYSIYATRDGRDSHPSAEGNAIATREFVSFLNKAVNRFTTVH
jgi:hypothetical protein